jgi:TorA maturation chaperone TorD
MNDTTLPDIAFDPALNFARQSLYRFAALTLLDPRAGSWKRLDALRRDSLVTEAAALVRDEPAAAAEQLALGERPLADLDPQPVLKRLPESAAALNEAYERTFGLLVSGACPPYESEYIDGKFTFQRSQSMGDVGGFYSAFGLQPSREHPERHDHVVLELEFMALLLGLERRAAESDADDGADRAAVCRDAQTKFLKEHLDWWTPAFAKLLTRQDPGGFYEAASHFLAALIPAERSLLGVEPGNHVAAPSSIERPEACEGCLLTL